MKRVRTRRGTDELIRNYNLILRQVIDLCDANPQGVHINSAYMYKNYGISYEFIPLLIDRGLLKQIPGTTKKYYQWIGEKPEIDNDYVTTFYRECCDRLDRKYYSNVDINTVEKAILEGVPLNKHSANSSKRIEECSRFIEEIRVLAKRSPNGYYINSINLMSSYGLKHAFMNALEDWGILKLIGSNRNRHVYQWIAKDLAIDMDIVASIYRQAVDMDYPNKGIRIPYESVTQVKKERIAPVKKATKVDLIARYRTMLSNLQQNLSSKQSILHGKMLNDKYGVNPRTLDALVKLKILGQSGSVFPFNYSWISNHKLTDKLADKVRITATSFAGVPLLRPKQKAKNHEVTEVTNALRRDLNNKAFIEPIVKNTQVSSSSIITLEQLRMINRLTIEGKLYVVGLGFLENVKYVHIEVTSAGINFIFEAINGDKLPISRNCKSISISKNQSETILTIT